MTTPNLALSELEPSQAQAHIPINMSLRTLDVLVQLSCISRVAAVEGVSPEVVAADGDAYLITSGDNENAIAFYRSNAWVYYSPGPGWIAYVADEDEYYYFSEATSPVGWAILDLGQILTPGEWSASDPYRVFEIYDDCLQRGLWAVTGNVVNFTGEASAPGVAQMVTGTSSSGEANILYGGSSGTDGARIRVSGGEIEFEARLKVSAVADGTQSFDARAGLGDESTGAPDNGIYFSCAPSTGVIQYNCRSAAGSPSTVADPDGDTLSTAYRTLRFVVNAAGTSVDFYLDGALKATISTDIPSAALAPFSNITKSAGTTSRTASLDYFRLRQTFSAERFP